MKVLLLGGGGREHAIAWKLARSAGLTKLWCAPGSDAIAALAEPVPVDPLDPAAVAAFVTANGVDLVFVGPEAPLDAGVSDATRTAGALVFGPSKSASRLETSKAFAKEFMARHGIPTARARRCATAAEAKAAAREFGGLCAVKADGIAAGKGVIVCGSPAEAAAAVDALAATSAGKTLVVERRLEGREVTVMAVVSDGAWAALPFSRDHKRLRDGDEGPNTGGMGAIAPIELDDETWRRIRVEILDRTMAGLAKDGLEYRGALYAGVMLTAEGPMLLEYNARFGDPETQAVLPLLDEDLLALAVEAASGRLRARTLRAEAGVSVAVVLSSPGYPESPRVGTPIDLNGVESLPDTLIFHAGTKKSGAGWVSAGGRVLSVVGRGADAEAARARAYDAVKKISAPGLHWRADVGASVLRRTAA